MVSCAPIGNRRDSWAFSVTITLQLKENQGMRRFNGLCCLLTLVASVISLRGQQGTSTMIGVVSDPTDAMVPNATLTLTEQANGAVRTMVTPVTGLYRFIDLPPGRYSLR